MIFREDFLLLDSIIGSESCVYHPFDVNCVKLGRLKINQNKNIFRSLGKNWMHRLEQLNAELWIERHINIAQRL